MIIEVDMYLHNADPGLMSRAAPHLGLQDTADWIAEGNVLFQGPHAVAMLEFPSLGRPPTVIHFYAECMSARRAMVAHVLNYMAEKGYNTFRATNGSGHDEKVWRRAFEQEGWRAHPKQMTFDFEKVS